MLEVEGRPRLRGLLIARQGLLRQALRALLDDHGQLEVVAEVASPTEALALVGGLSVDVVMVVVPLAGSVAVEIVRDLSGARPQAHIVVLVADEMGSTEVDFRRAGAGGFLRRKASRADLSAALDPRGQPGGGPTGELSARDTAWNGLSPREREMVVLLARGVENHEIGRQLSLRPSTVATLRYRVFRKLGVGRLDELVRLAHRLGLPTDEGGH